MTNLGATAFAAACAVALALQANGAEPFEAALAVGVELDPRQDPAPVKAALARAGESLAAELAKAGSLEARGEALARAVHETLGLAVEEDPAQLLSIPALLPQEVLRRKRGACLGLSLYYLALARATGLDAVGVSMPGHFFVRLRGEGRALNLETTLGGVVRADAWYREKSGLTDAAAPAGNYLRDLTADEVLAEVLNNAGGAVLERGDAKKARALLERACALAPEDPDAHYDLALALRAAKDPALAEKAVERALELYPRGREALNLRGLLRLDARPDLAEADFTAAIELERGEARYWNNRGVARGKMGELREARTDLERALELRPEWDEARRNLLLVRLEGEEVVDVADQVAALQAPAREELLRALPGGPESLMELARATEKRWPTTAAAALLEAADRHLRARDARAAREACDRALGLQGVDRVLAYCRRGLASEGLGDETWAKRNYVLAMDHGPRDPRGFRHMADHYLRRDRLAVASEYLRGYLERAPADAPDRADVEALVRSIEASKGGR